MTSPISENPKIIIFYTPGLNASLLFKDLIKLHHQNIAHVVAFPIIPYSTKTKRRVRTTFRKLLSSPPSFLFFQWVIYSFFVAINNLFGASIKSIAKKSGVRFRVQKIADDEFLTWLAKQEPDLIINGSSLILRRELLDLPRVGVLNCHGASLPEYRGAANIFWMLGDGIKHIRGTIHFVDEQIDHGDIIDYTDPIEIRDRSTVFANWLALRIALSDKLNNLVQLFLGGNTFQRMVQDEQLAKIRSFPDREILKTVKKRNHAVFDLSDFVNVIRLATEE